MSERGPHVGFGQRSEEGVVADVIESDFVKIDVVGLGFVNVIGDGGVAGLAVDQFKFPLRVSIMANLRGLIFGLMGTRLPAIWTQALTIVVSAILLLWVVVSTPTKIRAVDALVIAITALFPLLFVDERGARRLRFED